jgi:hypothetical protein
MGVGDRPAFAGQVLRGLNDRFGHPVMGFGRTADQLESFPLGDPPVFVASIEPEAQERA